MLASAACRRRGRVGALRDVAGDLGLRFVTVAVDQCSGGAWRQPDIGPVLEGVAGLHRGMEDASRDELIPSGDARRAPSPSRRNQFRDDTPVGGDRNPLAGFNAADVSAQVIPQLANAGVHCRIIATYGYIGNWARSMLSLSLREVPTPGLSLPHDRHFDLFKHVLRGQNQSPS
jgi:hypothetical protein